MEGIETGDMTMLTGSLFSYVMAALVALSLPAATAAPGTARALAIVAPSDEQTIYHDRGVVVICLAPVAPLAESDRIVVRIDEQIVLLPAGSTKFALTGVPPGTHVLEALVVDADTNPVSASDSVTFHMGGGVRT
jgi:hypothetical protein